MEQAAEAKPAFPFVGEVAAQVPVPWMGSVQVAAR